MKKVLLIISVLFISILHSQEVKQVPMINVSGEGKIKVAPDQALITISLESKGNNAKEVKQENDRKIDAILKFIKNSSIAKEDFQTQRVALNPNYDYNKKKYNYVAVQTIDILLRDLSKYDGLMEGLLNEGLNKIDKVSFKSSKMMQLQSDARKLAINDAKAKAADFVSVLGQKVGKAIVINDNSQSYTPQPIYAMKSMAMSDQSAPRETLATGEIEIIANVSVSFALE